jgi:hypothetical protein
LGTSSPRQNLEERQGKWGGETARDKPLDPFVLLSDCDLNKQQKVSFLFKKKVQLFHRFDPKPSASQRSGI